MARAVLSARAWRQLIMKRFSGQVAIVTGAARGIGKATAHRLVQEGATVASVSRARRCERDLDSNDFVQTFAAIVAGG